MKLSVFLLSVLAIIGLASAQYGPGGSCICTDNYQPFCGTDEVTYSNKCQLECAQRSNPSLRIKFEGVCAVPYAPESVGQRGNTGYQPTTRPFIPPAQTRRPSYVPLPSPRPNFNGYNSGFESPPFRPTLRPGQGFQSPPIRPVQGFESPPFRPTSRPIQGFQSPPFRPTTRPVQGFESPPFRPTTRPVQGFQSPPFRPGQNQGYVPLPSPRPNSNAPYWVPPYNGDF